MIQDILRQYIAEHRLFDKDARLLLAVSGGGDSMAMLDLLHNEGYYCEVAHVNFELRGEDSNRDAALVEGVCKKLGLLVHTKCIDTRHYAQENKLSIEMAARDIRYAFFEEILDAQKLDYVVVAHHRNDVVETFFINLLRGTGLRGLTGIAPKNGAVVRPLLSVSHQDLILYLEERQLEYCTDETNFDTTILRNELRHRVIPDFEDKKPGFSEIMQRTVGRLRQSEAIVKAYVDDWKNQHVVEKDDELLIPKVALYSSISASEILFYLLQPLGFSIAIIDDLANQPNLRVGARFEATKYRLIVDRDFLIIGLRLKDNHRFFIEQRSQVMNVPLHIDLSFFERTDDFRLIKDEKIAFLDVDELVFPLLLRHWQEGDVFCPIGMGGKQKKVSDYFIDNKFSIPQKEKAWLLCSNDEIVWIVGHRLDERFKLQERTKSILKITL